MDFLWAAIALSDVSWIATAFVFGFLARLLGLPPLIGFLGAGFLLHALGMHGGELLAKLADLGITLLLFTIGLKINPKTLLRREVWGVGLSHMVLTTLAFAALLKWLAFSGSNLLDLSWPMSLVIAFALSFSSTVFAVKALESRGEERAQHGAIAIGILLMQDLAAVLFLVASTGKLPSIHALSLLALPLLRRPLGMLLEHVGHGELMILYGLLLALGGAELFELVGMKADLGALALGMLLSSHAKSTEMARSMLGFKDLFLIGFFLNIGLQAGLSWPIVGLAVLLTPLIIFKALLFLGLLLAFGQTARTAFLASLTLGNYSEFGLIVAAVAYTNGWLPGEWLGLLAVSMSLSFLLASPINLRAHELYRRHGQLFKTWQRRPEPTEPLFPGKQASIVIFGMGRVGTGAYQRMTQLADETVVGVDSNPDVVHRHRAAGRLVIHGDPTDADFWARLDKNHDLHLVMLAMPNYDANRIALQQLEKWGFRGKVVATARYPDEVEGLYNAGADAVFNIYAEAGNGFAEHALSRLGYEGTSNEAAGSGTAKT